MTFLFYLNSLSENLNPELFPFDSLHHTQSQCVSITPKLNVQMPILMNLNFALEVQHLYV